MAGVVDMLTGDTMRTVVIAEVGLGLLSSTLAADPSVALGLFGLVAIIQVITVPTIRSCSGTRRAASVLDVLRKSGQLVPEHIRFYHHLITSASLSCICRATRS